MTFCVDKKCTTKFQTLIAGPLYPSKSPLNLGETFDFGGKNYIGFFKGIRKFYEATHQ